VSHEKIFDQSYKRILALGPERDVFFEHFYRRFLASSPEVAARFRNTDMASQRRMLKKSFYSLLVFYASGSLDEVLERIASSHGIGGMGIEPALYDLWLECLVRTVADTDPLFSREVELAWRLVMSPGIAYMKFMSSPGCGSE